LAVTSEPPVDAPIMIIAFEGWNDAGSAASAAVAYLAEQWDAEAFASIDPEEFFDFSTTRPTVHFDEDGRRTISWPENSFRWANPEGGPDVVLLVGVEPQLRWGSFCNHVVEVADRLGARLIVTMGALLADVPHSRPVAVYGTAYDPEIVEQLSLTPSSYEGPTGIVGVLHDELGRAGLDSASLWAAVPSYVPSAPSPKAALALLARVTALVGVSVAADDLAEAAAEYEDQVDEAVSGDDESASWVEELEHQWDRREIEEGDSHALIAEVERFLRRQDG
jgi:predicted ATP-grasp superfamily ATP-dependent carboligase